jgi:uncharacterized membrane protein
MVFCPNCGAAVEGRFCGKCGTAVTPAAAAGGTSQASGAQPSGAQAPFTQPTSGSYASPTAAGLTENAASALCYLVGLITGVLFLVLAPYNQNKNIRFHAFQSIFLHVACIVAWIVLLVFESILAAILPWTLYFLTSMLSLFLFLAVFVLWVYMLISTYQGKRVKLPVIGDLAQQQA